MVSISAQSLRVLRDRVPLFTGLDDSELTRMMSQCKRRELEPGDQLIAEGTLATKLFVVVSGEATVVRSIGGTEEVIARLKPGAAVGEVGLVDRAPRSAKVVADGDAVILEFDHQAFEQADPMLLLKLYRNMSQILAARLRSTNELLDRLAQRQSQNTFGPGSVFMGASGASMIGIDAQGIDFTGADFSGANFENASFVGANMRGTDLTDADLTGACLKRASLAGADVSDVAFDDDSFLIGADETRETNHRAEMRRRIMSSEPQEFDSLAANLDPDGD